MLAENQVLARPPSFLEASDLSPNPASETTMPESRAFFQTRLRLIWPRQEASWLDWTVSPGNRLARLTRNSSLNLQSAFHLRLSKLLHKQ